MHNILINLYTQGIISDRKAEKYKEEIERWVCEMPKIIALGIMYLLKNNVIRFLSLSNEYPFRHSYIYYTRYIFII